MLKAGIPTDSKVGAMLLKTYEGDLSPEALAQLRADYFPAEPSEVARPVNPFHPAGWAP